MDMIALPKWQPNLITKRAGLDGCEAETSQRLILRCYLPHTLGEAGGLISRTIGT